MTLEGPLMRFSLEVDGVLYDSVEAKYSPCVQGYVPNDEKPLFGARFLDM